MKNKWGETIPEGLALEELVPARKIREILLQLDEASPDDEIRDTLERIADNDVRSFLFDIINLVRSGDHRGAEARLRLGTAVPVDDAGGFAQDAAGSGANSDQALVINELSKEKLDRLLDPVHFQDWMLFLHPNQKSLAETLQDLKWKVGDQFDIVNVSINPHETPALAAAKKRTYLKRCPRVT